MSMGTGSGRQNRKGREVTATQEWQSWAVAEWERRGAYRTLHGWETFTMDVAPTGAEEHEPLLILHGFPTCSFDFHHVIARLSLNRRVLLLDLIGYGLSAKPDIAYTMNMQADVVQAFVAETGISRLEMLTHDMGDTVGGELLARQSEGRWPVDVVGRVITNGSIYIEMAHLSAGQELLLSLDDESLPETIANDGSSMQTSLAATFSPHSSVDDAELAAAWELISHGGGQRLLPRTIRYIEERRKNQARYTGAIESHPSPLAIVWGADDPIAVVEMTTRLHEARPDASLTILGDVGHFPMVESPRRFEEAVVGALG
jgi:pimeloyl-ACP methyl ester carboxylesterase